MDREILDRKIGQIVREAGAMLKGAKLQEEGIRAKEGEANFVTEYDSRIQSFLIRALRELLPDASFFGEEETEGNERTVSSGCTFLIDPIDGTTNFMFGYHFSCVSVGLALNGRMEAGWVYNPFCEDFYYAARGKGAWQNGRRLAVKDKPVEEGIVAFGCARYNEGNFDLLFDMVKQLFMRSLSIRSGGSAALDLCRVAAGANAAYLELKLQPYDYAAASVIIEEAGGVITQFDENPVTLHAPCSVIAGTRTAARQIRDLTCALTPQAERIDIL